MSRVLRITDHPTSVDPLMHGKFDYHMSCGHTMIRRDLRCWRGGVLTQPKTAKCRICHR